MKIKLSEKAMVLILFVTILPYRTILSEDWGKMNPALVSFTYNLSFEIFFS